MKNDIKKQDTKIQMEANKNTQPDLFDNVIEEIKSETEAIPANLTGTNQLTTAYLKTILHLQMKIMEVVSQQSKEEIMNETRHHFKEALKSAKE